MSIVCTFRIDEDINNELIKYAKSHKRSKSFYISEAVKNYMQELKEDEEDSEIALVRMNNPNKKVYSSGEATQYLRSKYGI